MRQMCVRAGRTIAAVAILLPGLAAAQTTQPTGTPVIALPPVEVIGTSPLIGSGIDRNTVPAETHVLNSNDLQREGTPSLVGALNREVSGVTVDSASGNPYQPTFFYHGFAASPLQGTPQGLAVYINGVRFNQPFGDTVDWDLIPDIAIDRLNLEGSNPVFGLNALGGSVNVQLKNGFTWQGFEADVSAAPSVRSRVNSNTASGPVTSPPMSRARCRIRTAGEICSPPTCKIFRRRRLAERASGVAPERHRGAFRAQRAGHRAGATAGGGAASPVHGAESGQQPICGGQPERQRRA